MKLTKTQRAKQCYTEIALMTDEPVGPGLYRHGLLRRWHWVTKNRRAYRLDQLPTDHLKNTLKALVERHPDDYRIPLELEWTNRRIKILKKYRRTLR